jgi:type I restriction enzyme S subunit
MELKKGYKQTEVGVIPIDWEVKNLMECCTKIQDGNYGESYPKSHEFLEFGIPFLTSKAIGKDGILNESKIDFISKEKHSELIKGHLNYEDVLFTNRGASVGAIGFVEEKICNGNIGPQLTLLRSKKDVIQPKFLFQALKSEIVQRQIKSNDSGSAMNFFGIGETSKFKILLPQNQQEQIVIAKALSDADAYITSLKKLIEKKRQIKQGAMQELLKPKDGWELTNLGYLVEIKKGQLITDTTKIDGNIPVIAGGKKPAYFHNKPNRGKNTITISGSGASAGYVSFHDYPIFASDCSTIEENHKISIHFVFYFLQLNQEKIYKMQTGGAQPHIHPSDLKPIQIAIPSKDIQLSIANILIEMDKEIVCLEGKLKKAKYIKDGMMQNLLTGKIRII